MKIALGFRYAQTLLNLAFARFVGAIFGSYSREFKKKQKQLGIRFAHELFYSIRSVWEANLESSHPCGMLCHAGD